MFNKYLPSISFHVNIFFFVTFDHIATLFPEYHTVFWNFLTRILFLDVTVQWRKVFRGSLYSRLKGCARSSHAYGE